VAASAREHRRCGERGRPRDTGGCERRRSRRHVHIHLFYVEGAASDIWTAETGHIRFVQDDDMGILKVLNEGMQVGKVKAATGVVPAHVFLHAHHVAAA